MATVPCDSPFLPSDLVARLRRALDANDAQLAVARTFDQPHPVFALVRRDVLLHLTRFLEGGGRKIDAWYATLRDRRGRLRRRGRCVSQHQHRRGTVGGGRSSYEPVRAMTRLGDHTAGRANNTQLLRLLAASAVMLFHCYAFTGRTSDEPLYRFTLDTNFGTLGVKCFFVLSGFLVTQSWLRRAHLPTFVAARALRIYPALIAAVTLSIVLAKHGDDRAVAGIFLQPHDDQATRGTTRSGGTSSTCCRVRSRAIRSPTA